jgi:hypothetical protein
MDASHPEEEPKQQGPAEAVRQVHLSRSQATQDAQAQADICKRLEDLAIGDERNLDTIEGIGGIHTAIEAMKAFPGDANAQISGCKLLVRFAKAGPQNFEALVGGIEAVVHAMTALFDSKDVQINGCRALSEFAAEAKNHETIKSNRGVAAIVRAMSAYADDAKVQINACDAIANLTSRPNNDDAADLKLLIKDPALVHGILLALETHRYDAEVVQAACAAMVNLAESPQRQGLHFSRVYAAMAGQSQSADGDDVLTRDPSAVHGILLAMEAHKSNEEIVKRSCKAIGKMMSSPVVSYYIVQSGGVKKMVSAINANMQCKELHLVAVGIFMTLAVFLPNKNMVRENKGIECLIDCMIAGEAQAETSCTGAFALDLYASHNQGNRDCIREQGGWRALVTAMKMHPANCKLQSKGCETLFVACRSDPRGCTHIQDIGGFKVMFDAMARHPQDATIQDMAFKVLILSFESCGDIRGQIVDNKGVPCIVSVLHVHATNADLVSTALMILRTISEDDREICGIVANCRGIEGILAGMSAHESDDEIQQHGCAVLFSLVCREERALDVETQRAVLEVCVRVIKTHVSCREVLEHACHVVVDSCCAARADLVVQLGVLPTLAAAMHANKDDAEVLSHCAGAMATVLVRVGKDHAEGVHMLKGVGMGLDMVMHALQHHVSHCSLQQNACAVLCYLLPDAAQDFVQRDGLRMLVKVINAHTHCNTVQTNAFSAIRWVTTHRCLHTAILQHGCIPVITCAMASHVTDEKLQRQCLKALKNLTEGADDAVMRALVHARCVDVVHMSMRAHSESRIVQSVGAKLLQGLTSWMLVNEHSVSV